MPRWLQLPQLADGATDAHSQAGADLWHACRGSLLHAKPPFSAPRRRDAHRTRDLSYCRSPLPATYILHHVWPSVADATRILREIKLLRLLRHPDIVEIKHIMLPVRCAVVVLWS